MQKKAAKEKQGRFARFCSATEKPARISLILAAAIAFATVGTVCVAAIMSNKNVDLGSENVELNAAQQYLDQISFAASSSSEETSAESSGESSDETSEETKETKRGSLTGDNVVDIKDLKSLSNEDLVKAIKQGKAGVIDKKNIKIDQSQDKKPIRHATEAKTPTPTKKPTPVPTNVPTPTMAPITVVNYQLGIDVSVHNSNINWSKVKASGVTFAFIRCGGRGWGSAGNCYEDTLFEKNIKNAKAAGIKVGVYYFSQAKTAYEALEEASITLSKLNGMSLDLPVVMDWETEPNYRTWKLGAKDLKDCIESFCSTIQQNGYTPMVYLDGSNINRLGKYFSDVFPKYRLWYAYPYAVYSDGSSYKTGDTVPPRSYAYEYWQYSWHGKVSGIPTEVDLDLRILGKTTLKAPEINITNKSITTETGQGINPMDGVKAKTCQGVVTTDNLSYAIKNEAGQSVTVDQAKQTPGKYIITYTFKDPFRGTITDTATWEVKAATATDTPSPTPSGDTTITPSPTPSSGATDTPSPTPQGSATDTPSPTPSEAPKATDTPVPTASPVPTKQEENTESTTSQETTNNP